MYEDPFAELPLESLTRDDTREWRARLQAGRANRSVNRLYRGVKAGLNRALELDHVGDSKAWTIGALADDVEDAETTETAVFLNASQRAAIIRAASPMRRCSWRGWREPGPDRASWPPPGWQT